MVSEDLGSECLKSSLQPYLSLFVSSFHSVSIYFSVQLNKWAHVYSGLRLFQAAELPECLRLLHPLGFQVLQDIRF